MTSQFQKIDDGGGTNLLLVTVATASGANQAFAMEFPPPVLEEAVEEIPMEGDDGWDWEQEDDEIVGLAQEPVNTSIQSDAPTIQPVSSEDQWDEREPEPVSTPWSLALSSPGGEFSQAEVEAMILLDKKHPKPLDAALPQTLHRWEQQTLRRRQQFYYRIHQLELGVARLTAQLADTRLERSAPASSKEDWNTLVDPFSVPQLPPVLPSTLKLMTRITHLESQLTEARHVQLTQPWSDFRAQIRKAHQPLDDRRLSGLVRHWDSLVATLTRRWYAEKAARKARLTYLQSQVEQVSSVSEGRAHEFLEQVQKLRVELNKEREQRRYQDQLVRQTLQQTFLSMQQAVWETLEEDV